MPKKEGLKIIKEINLMENQKLILWLNIATIPLALIFIVLFGLIPFFSPTTTGGFSLWNIILWLVAYVVSIICHELIHGLFFKIFHLEGKVKFGFKNGMAYATSPNSYYTKGQFAVIILAPFIVISTLLIISYYLTILSAIFFVLLAALHAGSCVGDFYFIYLICRSPKNCLIMDTEVGLSFYHKVS
ncbi:DUF3267 domain-containing protein [Bavariicoccus seileri]|uniref:DUF3267 domain-containing protein n=1 Tax=Bavariicoccus seileri TaxID=549685 RepID=UPI0003B3FB84|nr:DUF3267 domain-containing protein [Bavariicoccus seileri]